MTQTWPAPPSLFPLAMLSFASPWMLGWLLAATIPIAIHLWNRRTQFETRWGAMQFLAMAVRRHRRRRRLEQWFLLALRIMALVLAALAFAEPVFQLLPVPRRQVDGVGTTHTLLVLDCSYSMAARLETATRFEQAKEQAGRLVRQGRQGDGFTLVRMGIGSQPVIGDAVFDSVDVMSELESLRVDDGRARLAPALAQVEAVLARVRANHPRLDRHRVCVFTDLGENTWAEVDRRPVREQLARLAEIAELRVMEVGEPVARNLGVSRIHSIDSVVARGKPVEFVVEVRNYGTSDETTRLQLLHLGREFAGQLLTIGGGGTATFAARYRFDASGPQTIEAKLADDDIPTDNHRWLTVDVRESFQVLMVQGKPGEATFLELALQSVGRDAPLFQTRISTEGALLDEPLEGYDCVVLGNVGRISRAEADILHGYVVAGGGLLVVPGDLTQEGSYNDELGGDVSGQRVLPGRLLGVRGGETRYLDPLDYVHPIARPFRGHEQAGLLTVPIWRYFGLQPKSSSTQVVLQFDNQDPFLLSEAFGAGRVLLFASPLSTASTDATRGVLEPWNAICTWPSFPPLVHEAIRYVVGGDGLHRNRIAGEPLRACYRGQSPTGRLALLDPFDARHELALAASPQGVEWSYESTEASGPYQVIEGDEDSVIGLYSVNPDTDESLPGQRDAASLPSQLQQPAPWDETAFLAQAASDSRPLFRWFLAGALGLLVGESVWACSLGRRQH